ncbi:hypothetical protein ACFOOP_10960 [Marinicaulis aureus]|uniref:Lipoprotein n=1 Tax=Hyphococcus aureus TaxID=2666033 RepID=A0ABW1L040_9PROT
MKRVSLFLFTVLLTSGCTTYRAVTAKKAIAIQDLGACSGRTEFSKNVGAADKTLSIPGGGYIDVHDTLIKPNGAGKYNAALSILSLGAWDAVGGGMNALSDCSKSGGAGPGTGGATRCDYKKLRFFVHYADAGSEQIACWEMKEVWVGSQFRAMGDESKCPIEYKASLSKIIDTSDLPSATVSWVRTDAPAAQRQALLANLEEMPVHEQLQLMAADHRVNCSK